MENAAPRILAVGRALPANYVSQSALTGALREAWEGQHHNLARLEPLHHSVGVTGRHLALPLEDYRGLDRERANQAWLRIGGDLAERAAAEALRRAGLEARDLDHLFFVTVTGLATPTVDVLLANRLGLRADLKRTPIFGLGCMAGGAGLARAADYLRAFPEQTAMVVSVELCSLTLQRTDASIANLIASGLFGDGAAAVVLSGGARAEPGPRVLANASSLYRDTEWVMGWEVLDSGFKVILSAKVPQMVRLHLRQDLETLLGPRGLRHAQIQRWISHPGGPRVLEAIEQALELPEGALELSWRSLAAVGNLSSASVLFILGDALEAGASPGDLGVVLAMGPGFGTEALLLTW